MRKIGKLSIITLLSISFSLFGLSHFTVLAADEDEISMKTSPVDALFDIDNMKPGDWAPRTVTVQNDGKRDFDYLVELNNKGSDKLFNELIMEVEKDNDILYNGKVADFTHLPQRELRSGHGEDLKFTIRFPEHLGNDFQGLETNFSLIFTAADKEDDSASPVTSTKGDAGDGTLSGNQMASLDGTIGSSGDSGSILPKTATFLYNFLIIGSILAIAGGILAIYSRKRKKHR